MNPPYSNKQPKNNKAAYTNDKLGENPEITQAKREY